MIVNVPVPVPPAFLAVSVIVNVPAVVGIPLIIPELFKLNPAGNDVEL